MMKPMLEISSDRIPHTDGILYFEFYVVCRKSVLCQYLGTELRIETHSSYIQDVKSLINGPAAILPA